ncbi:FUSC family protein [Micromonospora sp. 067-2]|uniref:FUSC family protein n=1 Tax=Micromonospora sp. 067-2 TaxID=2789270 RepID=UPI00397981F6
MLGTSLLGRLRRRDPGDAVLRRAARLTLVASTVFYAGRYGVGDPVLATYGLFGTVAAGAFAQLPGPARERSRILLGALPVGWLLITAGTLLAGSTAAAAGGMLVIGFVVAFAGVGNPRLVGLASAFQLFYILACFPPYQPGTLPQRLAGVTLAIVLLAVAELVLWPDPVPVSYRHRLAHAADGVAAFLDDTADALTNPNGVHVGLSTRREQATDAVTALALSRISPAEAPTAADARDRALRLCAAALREVLAGAGRLAAEVPPEPSQDLAAARLLRSCADTTRAAGAGLSPGAPRVDLDALTDAIRRAEVAYPAGQDGLHDPPDVPRMCRDATALALADQIRVLAVGSRVASGLRPTAGNAYSGLFEYAQHGPWRLYWWQFRVHLAPRSAHLQSSLRLAVALAVARVVAGALHLTHGFWVLLATLTVLRTSAPDTRSALRPAVLGTIAGAAVSAPLMLVINDPIVYAVALPVALMMAFGVGRLLGPVWQQALFTLLLTIVFAQLTPEGWRLAEARLVDVVLGAAIGVLAGLAMWPHGASRDLRRNTARYLAASGNAIEQTVRTVLDGAAPERGFDRVRRRTALVDSSYWQYHSERHDPVRQRVDWEAVLDAGHHVMPSAESLLRRNPPGCLAGWPAAAVLLRNSAAELRSAYDDLADQVATGRPAGPMPAPTDCVDELDRIRPLLGEVDSRSSIRHLVEVDRWLAALADGLARARPTS